MNYLRFLPAVVFVLALGLLVIDSFGSGTKVHRFLHIQPYAVALFAALILIGLRTVTFYQLLSKIKKLNTFFVLPLSLGIGVVLTVWDAWSSPNYVFSLTHLQPQQFLLISLLSLVGFLYSQSDKWFARHLHVLLFSGAFIFVGYISVASLLPFSVFEVITQEDSFIEYLQVSVLFIGALLALKTALQYRKQKLMPRATVFLVVFFGLLFICGDEISWGQRLLGVTTPESIAQINMQEEITVHNLTGVHALVSIGYIVIGAFGASAWLLMQAFPKQLVRFRLYIPHWSTIPYFYLGFLYNYYTRLNPNHSIGVWSESAELMLYTGIMFTLFLQSRKTSLK